MFRHTREIETSAPAGRNQVCKFLNRHFQEMFDTIFIRALQRLHRAKKRENLFNGEQCGFGIGFRHGDIY